MLFYKRLQIFCVLLLGGLPFLSAAQSGFSTKAFRVESNSIQIDSLSLVRGSVSVFTIPFHQAVDSNSYFINYDRSILFWKAKPTSDSVLIRYSTLPFNIYQSYQHKDYSQLNKTDSLVRSGFLYTPETKRNDPLDLGGVNYNGSFIRGLSFGNNQDVVLNSSFNLQMDGLLPGGIELNAALTDNNVPVQPEGNTQQLQEFDKVFIRLKKDKTALTVGDFEAMKPLGYFLNYNKKLQGARLQTEYNISDSIKGGTDVGVAVAKGKYARNQINGQEGNQGPYKLRGANGEVFIIVLSGSEKVFIDGIPLQRGADQDYVIDYNTGEVTFTPRRLINSAHRVTIEFEYSEKNYFRSLAIGSQHVDFGKVNIRVNAYTEQDNKNQPVQQDLDSVRRNILAQAGDSLQYALVPGFDSVGFNADKILYKRLLLPVYGYVFEYSINPDSAVYEVRFSYVGNNKGNYNIANTTANGRVYKWVQPIAGVPQGSYEPFVQLIPPQSQRMITGRVEYKPDDKTVFAIESAVSNRDVNTFSSLNNSDNDGAALLASVERTFRLQQIPKDAATFSTGLRYEYNQRTFVPIEVFRPVEFERDWNTNLAEQPSDLHQAVLDLNVRKTTIYRIQSQTSFLQRDAFYQGFRQVLNGMYLKDRWNINTVNSVTFTKSVSSESRFTRPLVNVAYLVSKRIPFYVGVKSQAEENKIVAVNGDTLSPFGFRWYDYGAFIKRPDTSRFNVAAGYTRRYDEKPFQNSWHQTHYSDNVESNLAWRISDNQNVSTTINYRQLHAIDTFLVKQRDDESLASRTEYNGLFKNGLVNVTASYELGSGLQQKQEFVYVQVPPGQGVFAYISDYNSNGVKDLNEFEVAPFQDQAEYIKVFIPTNEYVKVYTTRLTHSLSLQPRVIWAKSTGLKKFVARWANTFSVQLDNKLQDLSIVEAANPFRFYPADSQLVTTQNLLSNLLSFNRTDPVFGVDFNWQRNSNKSLLNNGFESRDVTNYGLRARWNITRKITFQQNVQRDIRIQLSEFYPTRNYRIEGYTLEPNVSYQFKPNTRLQLGYTFREAENVYGELKESMTNNKVSAQFRTGSVGKSLVTIRTEYAKVATNAASTSSISYALLEGLQRGDNMLWNVTVDKKLSKVLEMSISYDGRKTGTADAVHVGRAQVRAIF